VQSLFVHQEIANAFTNEFTKRAFETLKLGDPMDPTTNIGPIAQPEG